MQNISSSDKTSPDGAIKVEFEMNTGRMSHEIRSPRVVALPGGDVLADLWGTQWDASAHFDEPAMVRLSVRCYPGDKPGFEVLIDARSRTFRFKDSPAEQHPLERFEKLLKQKHATQQPYPPSRPIEPESSRLGSIIFWVGVIIIFAFIIYVFTLLPRPRRVGGGAGVRVKSTARIICSGCGASAPLFQADKEEV